MNHDHGSAGLTPDFFSMWGPEMMLLAILLAAAYLATVGPLRKHFSDATPVPAWRKSMFLLGLLLLYIAQGSPLNYYGHHFLFSAHMVQQCLLFIFMPPLLLLGSPEWLLKPLFKPKVLGKVLRFLTNPLIAVLAFNSLFSFYHLPFLFDMFHSNMLINTLYHFVLLITAFIMWWPILSPISEQEQLSDLRKIAYICVNGFLLTPACALIIFSDNLLFQSYMHVPQLFEQHSLLQDQKLGGVLMKLLQEGSYGSVLAYIFFRWYRKEREKDGVDLLSPQVHILPDNGDNTSRA